MNKWKFRVLSAGFSIILGLSFGSAAYASSYSWTTETENLITTGNVSISVQEYQKDENGIEISYQDGRRVLPGQKIDKIVRVTNEGNDAWIRAKAVYWSETGLQGMGDDMLGGIDSAWVKCDDYFYYTKPVLTGGSVDFFQNLTIPKEWGREAENEKFQIGITVQAIQAAAFAPDFSQDMPWFGIPVEASIHRGYGTEPSEDLAFMVMFENGSEGFVKTDDDFFRNFGSIQPGETRTGIIQIGSHFGKTLDIRFRTEVPDGQAEETMQLLEDLTLTIQKGEEIIYHGPLSAKSLKDGVVIAEALKKDQVQSITYSVSMPNKLGNASGLQQAKVRWIFSTQYTASSGGSGQRPPTERTDGGSGIVKPAENVVFLEEWLAETSEDLAERLQGILPFTGDRRQTVFLSVVMAASGLGILVLLCGKRKILWILAAVALCMIGGTLAYYVYGNLTRNGFSVGTNTIEIVEEYTSPKELIVGENTFQKKVQVENTGSIPCFVRVFADFSDSDVKQRSELSADGNTYHAAVDYAQNLPEGWIYVDLSEDVSLGGFYYYVKELKPGEKTPALFSWVRSTFEQASQIQAYEIIVYGESVQTRDRYGASFSREMGWQQAWLEFLERR